MKNHHDSDAPLKMELINFKSYKKHSSLTAKPKVKTKIKRRRFRRKEELSAGPSTVSDLQVCHVKLESVVGLTAGRPGK